MPARRELIRLLKQNEVSFGIPAGVHFAVFANCNLFCKNVIQTD
jgi:hypothetical protein